MARKLKVYRTVAGFHDAYVAAPSQKAALAAWGSDKDLFARGDAELIDDPALMAAPLADPGTVIRLSRGTTAEQIAAMPEMPQSRTRPDGNSNATDDAADDRIRPGKQGRGQSPPAKGIVTKPAKPPKPSRDKLLAAGDALEHTREAHKAELVDLKKREAALARARQDMERRQRAEEDEAQQALDEVKDEYEKALKRWND